MKHALVPLFASLYLLVVTDGSAAAQGTFGDLRARLKTGDVVSVTDDAGKQTNGRVESLGGSLRLSVDGAVREFTSTQVTEIRRRGDSLTNGMVKGAVFGGLGGLLFGSAVKTIVEAEGEDFGGAFAAFIALGAGAGAGIGAGLDAAVTGSTLVYKRPTRTVTVGPVVAPRAQGVRISLAF
jgi:hypothetical protein